MIRVNTLNDEVLKSDPFVMVIGNFDGVHPGHLHLIETAKSQNLNVAALTFDPHPGLFFNEDFKFLTDSDLKSKYLMKAGVDILITVKFDRKLASLTPDGFARMINVSEVKKIVVGNDFRFGNDRTGDINFLRNFFGNHVEIIGVEPVKTGNVKLSSSRIRDFIASGNILEATSQLGRRYCVHGEVVHGAKIGSELGYPTVNLETLQLIPGDGVYAVLIHTSDNRKFSGAASIGNRSTIFENSSRVFEVHILNFDGIIYGEKLRVKFVEKIREQKKYSDLEQLKYAIQMDIDKIRDILIDDYS
ncbi:MAG: riboflavin biosynthesis protein RibF [Deltaproteobacteria bacterium]|nr:riboflavin biosynthesis protein RibF [Deltaproteobacteria bacterium]